MEVDNFFLSETWFGAPLDAYPRNHRFSEGSSNSREKSAYQVFLSFRGEDVRKSFINHLHHALKQKGISTFHDDSKLERGRDIQSKLYEAIETSKLSIVTFSPKYATSRWCLDELVKIMECKSSNGHIVLPVFYGVDPTDLRNQSGPYQEAFDMHEVRFKDELHRVNKWRQTLKSTADLAGFSLQNKANGYEAVLIEHIIKEVVKKLDERQLSIPKLVVGAESLVERISSWLQNGSTEIEVGIIYGLGGVGKTTTAKVVYNCNFHKFESSSFLAGIRSSSVRENDFIQLQQQLLDNISASGDEYIKIYNVHDGREKIRKAIGTKKILVVLDDVDEVKQFHDMFDCPDWFLGGSKILITTRNQHLLNAVSATTTKFQACLLTDGKSTELFCHHAFSQSYPPEDYINISKGFIKYCHGLPLALEVLASSLRNKTLEMWGYQYAKLEDFPDQTVHNVLKLSFDSISDRNDEDIFLHIAFFMVGMKKGHALAILDGCGLHGVVGLDNLTNKCLVTVDNISETIVMHHLIQQMGYEVVRQRAPDQPGQRSRLLGFKDTSEVLRKNTGTSAIKGLHLDFHVPGDDGLRTNETTVEYTGSPSRRLPIIYKAIKTSAFTNMYNLDLLLLENVQHDGDFVDFPKLIKWLSWRGFSLKSIPLDFELDELVALDMQKSCLVHAWEGSKFMSALKVLNLSYSTQLLSTPDLSGTPMLEWISFEGCTSLIKLHESIGSLGSLTYLNLHECVCLVGLHENFGYLLKKPSKLKLDACVTVLCLLIYKEVHRYDKNLSRL